MKFAIYVIAFAQLRQLSMWDGIIVLVVASFVQWSDSWSSTSSGAEAAEKPLRSGEI